MRYRVISLLALLTLLLCGCSAGIYELSHSSEMIVKIELYSNSSEPDPNTNPSTLSF